MRWMFCAEKCWIFETQHTLVMSQLERIGSGHFVIGIFNLRA
jgi:hypothetical protein